NAVIAPEYQRHASRVECALSPLRQRLRRSYDCVRIPQLRVADRLRLRNLDLQIARVLDRVPEPLQPPLQPAHPQRPWAHIPGHPTRRWAPTHAPPPGPQVQRRPDDAYSLRLEIRHRPHPIRRADPE